MARMLALLALVLAGTALGDKVSANPIRKVIGLLEDMQKEIQAEGAKEKEMYDKFMCFCDGGRADLEKTAADAKSSVESLSAKIDQLSSEKDTLAADIKQHQADFAAATKDLSEASTIRSNENAEYEKDHSSKQGTHDALAKAIPAIEKGLAGSALVQFEGLNLVPQIKAALQASQGVLSSGNRRSVLAFLDGQNPGSSEIVGMLKSMKDEMARSLASLDKEEARSAKGFAAMSATKKKESNFARESTESKKERAGSVAVELVQSKNANEDAAAEQADSEKFLATLDRQCVSKKAEWAERSKMRTEEVAAVGQAMAILNDDDALDVFKKAVPAALIQKSPVGFLQSAGRNAHAASPAVIRLQKAKSMLAAAAANDKSKPFGTLLFMMGSAVRRAQLTAGGVDFGEVIKMVDEMVTVLKRAGADDAQQKEFCVAELQKSEDGAAKAQDKLDSLSGLMEEQNDSIGDVTQELTDLNDGIARLDKDVAVATELRKGEHAEYLETVRLTETAVELLAKAKNRLQKFYNPTLYRAPPKQEISMEDKIVAAGTSALAQSETTFDDDTPDALIQIHAHSQQPKAPEAKFGGKSKKSGGVMALMDSISNELKASLQEAQFNEKSGQGEYVELMNESQTKRQQDGKSITDRSAALAQLKGELTDAKESQHLTMKELENTHGTIANLHGSCDFILKNFEYRAQARAAEINGLVNAKAVLSGANYA